MEEYEELDPEFKSILIDTMKNRSPYWALLGMEIVDVKKGWAKVRLPFKNELLQPLGVDVRVQSGHLRSFPKPCGGRGPASRG